MISEVFPDRLESIANMHRRSSEFKKFIGEFKTDTFTEQIAIVGHSNFYIFDSIRMVF